MCAIRFYLEILRITGVTQKHGAKKVSVFTHILFFKLCPIFRALTRILKTGVQDSHLAKSRSPTGKSGSPNPKKLESHQFVHTVYLFHLSRK